MQTVESGAVGKSAPRALRRCLSARLLGHAVSVSSITMHGTMMLLKVSRTAFSPAAPASLVPARSATLS